MRQIAAETELAIWSEVVAMEKTYNATMHKAGMKVANISPELDRHFEKIGQQMRVEWLQRAGDEGEIILRNLHKP